MWGQAEPLLPPPHFIGLWTKLMLSNKLFLSFRLPHFADKSLLLRLHKGVILSSSVNPCSSVTATHCYCYSKPDLMLMQSVYCSFIVSLLAGLQCLLSPSGKPNRLHPSHFLFKLKYAGFENFRTLPFPTQSVS